MNPRARQPSALPREKTYLEMLALEQGIMPVTDIAELCGDFWPEDEPVEVFIKALQTWRREGEKEG